MNSLALLLPPSTSDLLKDPLNRRLLEAAARFAKELERLGTPVQVYSDSSLQKLAEVSPEKKEQVARDFEEWSQWIEPLDPNHSYENEISLLKRALRVHGFEASSEFIKRIEKDQIIEIYDENMIQLYRSFNFYKITGYSLTDISFHEWYVLWDRPKQVLEAIASELNTSLENYVPVALFKTGKHVVREIFNATGSKHFVPRASLLNPVRLGSLKPTKFGRRKRGFICTSTGETIALGKEAENIQFI